MHYKSSYNNQNEHFINIKMIVETLNQNITVHDKTCSRIFESNCGYALFEDFKVKSNPNEY